MHFFFVHEWNNSDPYLASIGYEFFQFSRSESLLDKAESGLYLTWNQEWLPFDLTTNKGRSCNTVLQLNSIIINFFKMKEHNLKNYLLSFFPKHPFLNTGSSKKDEVPLVVLGIGKLCGNHEMGFLAYLSCCCPKFLYLLISKVHIIKLWVVALSGEDKPCENVVLLLSN